MYIKGILWVMGYSMGFYYKGLDQIISNIFRVNISSLESDYNLLYFL